MNIKKENDFNNIMDEIYIKLKKLNNILKYKIQKEEEMIITKY